MANYKLYVNDRNYSSWDVFDTINFNKIKLDINRRGLIHQTLKSKNETRRFTALFSQ